MLVNLTFYGMQSYPRTDGTFSIILQHFKIKKKNSTELSKQMVLFWFIIENDMQMQKENLVEVFLLYCLVQFH